MRKRTTVIPVRLYQKELHHLNEQVNHSGLSREEYLRRLLMGAEIRPKPCEHHPELLRQISGLCNNMNQLAKIANTYVSADQARIDEALHLARQIWKIVRDKW